MPKVFVRETESADSATRRFKRTVEKSGLYSELRRRAAFSPKSVVRKKAKNAAIRRLKKIVARQKQERETARRH